MSAHKVYDNPAADARSRCVWWLCGQCTGGQACHCMAVSTDAPGTLGANDEGNQTPDARQPWAGTDSV